MLNILVTPALHQRSEASWATSGPGGNVRAEAALVLAESDDNAPVALR